MPRIGRQHTEVLLTNPQINEQRKEPEGRDTRVSFSLVPFFWTSKRKELAAGLPPAIPLIEIMYQHTIERENRTTTHKDQITNVI